MRKRAVEDEMGMKKGPWTAEEDLKLSTFIQQNGHGSWRALPSKAGLQRCGKSCRLRWTNYLRPDIKRGEFTLQEDQSIIQLHALLGNRWSIIASHLPRRTDNEIKNYWNTHLKKKLTKMGIDPITHKPKNHALGCGKAKDFGNLCHMAQWESARLEAEARPIRVTRETLFSNPNRSAIALQSPLTMQLPCLDVLKVWARTNSGVSISSAMFNEFLSFERASSQSENIACNVDNCRNEVKGIMGNQVELREIVEPINATNTYYPELPDFVDGIWNVLEDGNVNYWGAL